jgi:hypothetical protein
MIQTLAWFDLTPNPLSKGEGPWSPYPQRILSRASILIGQ